MCNRVSAFRVRFLGQAAFVAVLAGLGAACSSDAAREPFFTGSTANQRAIIGGSGNTAVAQSALPPAQGAGGPINLASSQGGAWSAVGGQVVTVAADQTREVRVIVSVAEPPAEPSVPVTFVLADTEDGSVASATDNFRGPGTGK